MDVEERAQSLSKLCESLLELHISPAKLLRLRVNYHAIFNTLAKGTKELCDSCEEVIINLRVKAPGEFGDPMAIEALKAGRDSKIYQQRLALIELKRARRELWAHRRIRWGTPTAALIGLLAKRKRFREATEALRKERGI